MLNYVFSFFEYVPKNLVEEHIKHGLWAGYCENG